jgi:hypothetical protein
MRAAIAIALHEPPAVLSVLCRTVYLALGYLKYFVDFCVESGSNSKGESMQTARNSKGNFYEIKITRGTLQDGSGGVKYTAKVLSRVRHHKKLWPDSARWAEHQLEISIDFNDMPSSSKNRSGSGNEITEALEFYGHDPKKITVNGRAQTKDGYVFTLTCTS